MTDDLHEQFQAMTESMLLNGELDEAYDAMQQHLAADPEWTTPKYHHAHVLVQAFAQGVMSADPWHHGYRLPPHFEGVVNWIAFNVQRHWKGIEVPQVSLADVERLFRRWAFEHPEFRKWNETKPGLPMVAIVSRYSSVPDVRDFIDLDALLRNAVVWLRDETRKQEAFDRKFEEEMNAKLYIANAYSFPNGMVMCFDQHGQQMPDYQGTVGDVWHKILRDAPPEARLNANAVWRGTPERPHTGDVTP